jgi:hypothetical protein
MNHRNVIPKDYINKRVLKAWSYDVLSNFNKTRIDEIVRVEIAMVEATDRFKRDPLGIRSRIATIRRPGHETPETLRGILTRDFRTVQVAQDSVNNALHRHQRRRVSVPVMISNSLQFDLVPQGEACQHDEAEYAQQVQEC